ncbi:hypothetical protein [Arthrobacter sp. M4]|uniref:hypothetical protein n=1 Tax=Arthrobacter sp. M4 TaxID=218160 RepID=UPI001CDC8FAA|nr:hypothetical protein [Arthrobacter sp. M4]MCA4133724.1 hypothetical protein [Arthrobacter sp. M4]
MPANAAEPLRSQGPTNNTGDDPAVAPSAVGGVTPGQSDAAPSATVRAQLLATEHWSLLASRSTAQGEVLTRISMFLTFTSASLLSLALVGQATRFTDSFMAFAITILFVDVAIGLLTQLRVMNVALEDLMYVVAMNRLRAAYLDLDPGLARYFMAGVHDDQSGSRTTYDFFERRSTFSHVAGSSMIFMNAANSVLIALLAGTIWWAVGAPLGVCILLGSLLGAAFLVACAVSGYRNYRATWNTFSPVSPTPTPDSER